MKLVLAALVIVFAVGGLRPVFAQALAAPPPGSPVALHGALRVEGNRIVDARDSVTQLAGMSFFWHVWQGKAYWNAEVIRWLRDDWRVSLVRAPIGVHGVEGDYLEEPEIAMRRLDSLVQGAVREGVYVIIDFHAHNQHEPEAKTFFREVSARYGDYPNVLYEIWNEPVGEADAPMATWDTIRAYAKTVVAEIRANDPDNIIIVGTPFWSQRADVAALDPLVVDSTGAPVSNVAYTIHAYAGQHKDTVRAYADSALARGVALVMTECGRVGVNWGPENTIDSASFRAWADWMDRNRVSYCKWSLSTKDEVSSSLLPRASVTGGWTEEDLTPEGRWNRRWFRERAGE